MTYIGLETDKYDRTPPTGSNPLPAGLYTGVVTRTQLKDTKPDEQGNPTNGNYLEVEFDITSPSEFSNRKFWDRFNIVNKSQTATRIGKEQLSDLAKAAGLQVLSDDEELIGKEVTLILKVTPPKGRWEASNECQKYWPVGVTLEGHNAWLKSSGKGAGVTVNAPAQGATPKPAWGAKAATPTPAPAQEEQAAAPEGAKAKPWQKKA